MTKYSEKEVERILALRDASLKDPKHMRDLLECLSPACDQLAAAREIIRQVRAVLLYVNQWPGVGQCDLVEKALHLTEESSDE